MTSGERCYSRACAIEGKDVVCKVEGVDGRAIATTSGQVHKLR